MKITRSNLPKVDKTAYLAWIQAFREHFPQLNCLSRFPPDLAFAARNAFLSFPQAAQYAPFIARYYAAPASAISTYRPPSMRKMFEALHDIAHYAKSFCLAEDSKKRKRHPLPQPTTFSPKEREESQKLLSELKELASSHSIKPLPADSHL